MSLLKIESLRKSYGGLKVTDDVSFALSEGERMAIIGPNGAGKTTLISQVAGALSSDSGRIFLGGEDITAWPGHRRVGQGLVRTFQISKLAPDIPVIDQLALAIHQRDGSIRNMWRHKDSYAQVLDEASAILRSLHLSAAERRTPSEMAYGDQRLVEVALALVLKPRVLLLDEPMAGVPRSEAQLILDALERLPAKLAVIIIEHDMDLVFRFAQRILVLANGAVLADGTADEIRNNDIVRAVYLGKGGNS